MGVTLVLYTGGPLRRKTHCDSVQLRLLLQNCMCSGILSWCVAHPATAAGGNSSILCSSFLLSLTASAFAALRSGRMQMQKVDLSVAPTLSLSYNSSILIQVPLAFAAVCFGPYALQLTMLPSHKEIFFKRARLEVRFFNCIFSC